MSYIEGGSMTLESPQALLARLKLGREEYCQRLLTMLILDAPYPPWNQVRKPSSFGAEFLAKLDQLSFPARERQRPTAFIDEFELPARSEDERAGWPDYAVVWDERIWIIELKTEAASHRPGQLAHYADLARHHHSMRRIDFTYLTPTLRMSLDLIPDDVGLSHLNWDVTIPLLKSVWSSGDAWQQSAVTALRDVLAQIDSSWTHARPRHLTMSAAIARGTELSEAVAADGVQRATDVAVPDPEDLDKCRMQLNHALRATAEDSPLRHVRAWIWRAQTSGGRALTAVGAETGYELRLSRYVARTSNSQGFAG